jgi:hypothetical protein
VSHISETESNAKIQLHGHLGGQEKSNALDKKSSFLSYVGRLNPKIECGDFRGWL